MFGVIKSMLLILVRDKVDQCSLLIQAASTATSRDLGQVAKILYLSFLSVKWR